MKSQLAIYKEGTLYSIKDAYITGLITSEDVYNIGMYELRNSRTEYDMLKPSKHFCRYR